MRDADVLVEFQALFLPIFEQFHPLLRPAKVFQFHLLELARTKREIARVNFVAKCLPDLRDAERQFLARDFQHVFELDKDRLCRFWAQISNRRFVFSRADVGFEHQLERPRWS